LSNKLITILVTGADGQLGNELRLLNLQFPYCQFLFATREQMDITIADDIKKYFDGHSIEFCVNCAAYTAVDKAETEEEAAFSLNTAGVATLAKVCCENNTQLIHISTDYVFDGTATKPYTETDPTNPVSAYGRSKLKGEAEAVAHCPSTIIIRTAWLYSSFKNNFVKTMLRMMKERDSLNVVSDQFGCPTYAADLAMAIMQIINSGKSLENPGIYHYSNAGITNWYEFALEIKKLSGSNCMVNAISTAGYPTAAKRPAWSVLDTTKIKETFNIDIPDWKSSLAKCMALLR
jgi:dTDP-4-dehydrorhamnose reductase